MYEEDQSEVPHRLTNVEFITNLMEFSKYGGLALIFVIDALDKHAHAVANVSPEVFEKMAHFINPQAWQGVAREIAEKIDNRSKC